MSNSTESQRRFIDSLAKGKTMPEMQIILAPAFRRNSNEFKVFDTLNQNTKRLTKEAASLAITILKSATTPETELALNAYYKCWLAS